jgi:hypothetical protein
VKKQFRRLLDTLVIIFVLSSAAYAADAERTYQGDGHFYIIHFTYNTEFAMIPSVVGAQPHYTASITVSEIIDGAKKEISSFGGQYTEKGCFEDDPKSLVEQALKLQK